MLCSYRQIKQNSQNPRIHFLRNQKWMFRMFECLDICFARFLQVSWLFEISRVVCLYMKAGIRAKFCFCSQSKSTNKFNLSRRMEFPFWKFQFNTISYFGIDNRNILKSSTEFTASRICFWNLCFLFYFFVNIIPKSESF